VPDPNVVGFVLGLSPPPPPLPALLPRWSLPRQSGGGACLVSAVGGGRIVFTVYMYIYYKCIFSRFVFVVFLQPIDRAAAARLAPTVSDGCRTPRDPTAIVVAYRFNSRPLHSAAHSSPSHDLLALTPPPPPTTMTRPQ